MKILSQLTFVLVFFISCQKEDQLIPDTGRKLVINSLITTDSLLGVSITNSMYISDTLKWLGTDIINHAQAYVSENNGYGDSLRYNGYKSPYFGAWQIPLNYTTTSLYPVAGKEYHITVKAPGFPEAYATTKIPELVKIEKIDTTKVILEGTFEPWQTNIRLQCSIAFTDPAKERNFYLSYIYNKQNDNRAGNMEFSCTDPIVEENLNHGEGHFGIAFSDKSINGKKYKLSITLKGEDIGFPYYYTEYPPGSPFPQTYKTSIYFRLYSITEEYFKYIQTLNLFLKNYKDPLAEPTQVYSNIQGGYGIFAGASVSSDSIIYHK